MALSSDHMVFAKAVIGVIGNSSKLCINNFLCLYCLLVNRAGIQPFAYTPARISCRSMVRFIASNEWNTEFKKIQISNLLKNLTTIGYIFPENLPTNLEDYTISVYFNCYKYTDFSLSELNPIPQIQECAVVEHTGSKKPRLLEKLPEDLFDNRIVVEEVIGTSSTEEGVTVATGTVPIINYIDGSSSKPNYICCN